ncbi:MAG: pyrroline-5-carboxylate reductase [Synechococcales cyanobacterium]
MTYRLGIIGGGVMATALLRGLLSKHVLAAESIAVGEPDAHKRQALADELGVSVFADNLRVVDASFVILAIKPQVFDQVSPTLVPHLSQGTVVISIMAGIPISRLEAAFPGLGVVRTMPNTPALVSAGVTAMTANALVTQPQRQVVQTLLSAVGTVVEVPESLMDAVTAVSGSGPGYVALLIEAMIDGGVQAGLSRPLATQLVVETVLGTAQLLKERFVSPALLKDQVTSPGGTTIAGLSVLETAGVRGALMQAIQAALTRSQELAG